MVVGGLVVVTVADSAALETIIDWRQRPTLGKQLESYPKVRQLLAVACSLERLTNVATTLCCLRLPALSYQRQNAWLDESRIVYRNPRG